MSSMCPRRMENPRVHLHMKIHVITATRIGRLGGERLESRVYGFLSQAANAALSRGAQIASKRHKLCLWSIAMAARVLIVDDDPVQRRLLENMVRKFGHEPMLAEGGEQAAAMLLSERFDCVVLD